MLQITKTRQLVAEFKVKDGKEDRLVKTTTVNFSHDAVSTVYETLHEPELYAKNRAEMRKDEKELREMRYAIEDEILEALAKTETEIAE